MKKNDSMNDYVTTIWRWDGMNGYGYGWRHNGSMNFLWYGLDMTAWPWRWDITAFLRIGNWPSDYVLAFAVLSCTWR